MHLGTLLAMAAIVVTPMASMSRTPTAPPAQERIMAEDPRIAVVNQMIHAWNVRDWKQVGELFAEDGVLHFMHASAPRNYGKVVLDSRLSVYLARYSSNAGIMVARPLK